MGKLMQRCCALGSQSLSLKDGRASPAAIPPVSTTRQQHCQHSQQWYQNSHSASLKLRTAAISQFDLHVLSHVLLSSCALTGVYSNIWKVFTGSNLHILRQLVRTESTVFNFWTADCQMHSHFSSFIWLPAVLSCTDQFGTLSILSTILLCNLFSPQQLLNNSHIFLLSSRWMESGRYGLLWATQMLYCTLVFYAGLGISR